jgi:integrin beta 8
MIMDIIKISVNSQLFVCVYSEKINTSLGSAGSCLQKFSALPYLRCDHTNVCYYGQTNDLTYYLSTTEPMPMMPVQRDQIRPYISRCAVCEAPANVMSFHSLSMTPPPCPNGWNILWQGYSFVMVR